VRAALCRRRAPAKGESDSGDSGGRGRDVLDADQSGLLRAADCMLLSGGSERRGAPWRGLRLAGRRGDQTSDTASVPKVCTHPMSRGCRGSEQRSLRTRLQNESQVDRYAAFLRLASSRESTNATIPSMTV